jgi:ADP-ribosylglycohydrolase
MNADSMVGCVLGTAAGDALGLPFEGMPPGRVRRMFRTPVRHQFLLGYGMVSDDTEHTCLVAQALLLARGDSGQFDRHMARLLRRWLLGLPAGVGLASLKACLRLWMGFPPGRSGVFSAGNGPAMRSAILGTAFGSQPAVLQDYVLRSTRITHTDPKAYFGAMAVAAAAYRSSTSRITRPAEFASFLQDYLPNTGTEEFRDLMENATRSAARNEPLAAFAASIGCLKGISGYIYHTVPCVIQTWLRHQRNFRSAIEDIIAAGGDTDTTAAILGGIIGAGVGKQGIPQEWLSELAEWPRTVTWMEELGMALSRALAGDLEARQPHLSVPGIMVRNAAFTLVVLAHAVRRMAPPY